MSQNHTTFLDSLKSISDFTNDLVNSGVYCIYCKASDRYYIGQSQIIIKRVMDHLGMLRSERHPTKSMQKDFILHGEDTFKFGVILDMPDSTEAQRCNEETKELLLYQKYNRNLYNIALAATMRTQQHRRYQGGGKANNNRHTPSNERQPGHTPNSPYRPAMKKIDMSKVENGTCNDCGATGAMYIHIFVCDDKKKRCSNCIDRHLRDWRVKIQPMRQGHKDYKTGACFRWLIDDRKHIKEVLTMAVSRYIEKHGNEPDSILVNEVYDGPAEFDSIGIFTRRVTPQGHIDIPILDI